MPAVNPVIEWLQSPQNVGGAVGSVAFALWLSWDRFSKLRTKSLEKTYRATPETPSPVVTALPAPAPAALAAPHDYEAELHAMRIQRVHLQDELTAVQESARNLRKAHDAATFDLAAQAKALYLERSANEELRQKCAALLAEMARLRSQGPPSLPPPRSRRER
jgi:hypothetical protein